MFSVEEKAQCVVWFAASRSPTIVQRKFRAQYGRNVQLPDQKSIKEWFQKFMTTGDVKRKEKVATRWVRTNVTIQDVLAKFEEDPHASTRNVARADEMPSRRTIQRILHDEKFFPYRQHLCHQMTPQDHQRRLAHANAQLAVIANNGEYLNNLIFSDEAHFHVHGVVNRQDFRYWSRTNPAWYAEQPLHSPRVTVWAAIGHETVIGPFFFEGNVTGASYLELLQQRFLPACQLLPNFHDLVFMHDGAPPHWAINVRQWLTATFPNRWMGRGSPNFPWPPNSPDLTPMDFFLWGWIKDRVFRAPVADLTDLRARIQLAFQELPMNFVNRSIASYERRLQRCIANDGRTVELPLLQ